MNRPDTRGVPPTPPRTPARARDIMRRRSTIVAVVAVLLVAILWLFARRVAPPAETVPSSADRADSATAADSVVRLDSVSQRLAGVELTTVAESGTSGLIANGTITYDANRVSIIAPLVEARVVNVRADLGQAVRAGAVLATLESAEIGQTRGDLERARVNVDVAQRNYTREKRLYDEQISPQKELLDAEGTLKTAEADYNSALAKLRAVGASEGDGAFFGLSTPLSGAVVERNASPGQRVGPSTTLFTVADLRHVWISVDVYEGDLTRVRTGAVAVVSPTAYPGETFRGRVTYAGGIVDSASHTFKVRLEVENAAGRLRPGMFAQVRIETPITGGAGAIAIPEAAVQDLDGQQVVFVAGGEAGTYVVRTVTLGPRAGNGLVVIATGLTAGEHVVTKGAFQLKSELTKARFGEEG